MDAIEKRSLIYLLVAVSVILAALRGLSHLDLWGEGYFGSPVASLAGYVVVGFMLTGFTFAAVIRSSNVFQGAHQRERLNPLDAIHKRALDDRS
ncbi:hypothetical protein [Raoultibacter massiliensis]|uniref:hypothetical protein n=1 Tax=Raoultibacter massiliensis TaxID=1852371 RepID=UPI003A8DFCB6